MDDAPKVSVLVPVYNTAPYLRECLDSLIWQTLEDIQIICIDDGSTDASPAILAEYAARDGRIEVITKPNSGYGDSMNKGLQYARGEYVGIVEPDDFVEPMMFQELYDLAKQNGADVVKSRHFHHCSHQDKQVDEVVDTVSLCALDTVFDPLEEQEVLMTAPAIWSAIYRRRLLLDNGIEFLPTPGASFQDTAFHFKAFVSAKRAFISSKAYVHYRIDNANSSVKSQKKIFCICDEYEEIWRYAKEDPKRFAALKHRIPALLFQGYLWNLDRLAEPLQHEFYGSLVEELRREEDQGLLNEGYFDERSWIKVNAILSDPEGYYLDHYGPYDVDATYVVRFSGKGINTSQPVLKQIQKMLGAHDEAIAYGVEDGGQIDAVVEGMRKTDARIYSGQNLFVSKVLELIDPDRVRGKEVVLVNVEQADGVSPYIKSYSAQNLLDRKGPLFVPLLFSDLYGGVSSQGSCEPCAQYAHIGQAGFPHAEYGKALDAFDAIAEAVEEHFATHDYAQRSVLYDFLAPYWSLLKDAYQALSFSDRIQAGGAPSSAQFPVLVPNGGSDGLGRGCKQVYAPDVSVIIPVYNASKHARQCLESALAQQVDLEVICIDDGSTDDSWTVLEQVAAEEPRVTIMKQLNSGAGAARNRGINLARGKYLSFIDSDDFYPNPTVLSTLLETAKREGALVCGGSLELVNEDGTPHERAMKRDAFYTFADEGVRRFADYDEDYGWIRFMYKRSLFEDGSVRFPVIHRYEDPVFFLKVAQIAETFYQVPEAVYCYRIGYKERMWNASDVRGLLWGIQENLARAAQCGWNALYTKIAERLDGECFEAIRDFMDDEEVAYRLTQIQAGLDFDRLSFVTERGEHFHLLRVFRMPQQGRRDQALTRLSKKIEGTRAYRALQSVARAIKR